MSETLLTRVADCLEQNKDQIINKVSKKIYNIIRSYRKGGMPIEESRETMLATLGYIVDFLRNKRVEIDYDEGFLISEVVKFKNGIASKRIVYEIELNDLLRGIRIFRDEIWNTIAYYIGNETLPGADFFKLEKRINVFINYFMMRVTSAYNKTMGEIIGRQALDLLKWEEVVKSASNIELKVPCSGEFAAIVRLQAEAIARRLNYDEEEVQDIKVCVGEACDNAIEHGKSEKGFDVHYHVSLEKIRIEIIDYGCGFNPTGKGDEMPDPFAERGRGIFLMKQMMDRAEFYSKSNEGTMIVLVKKKRKQEEKSGWEESEQLTAKG